MKVLALDISTKCGWAILTKDDSAAFPVLGSFGTLALDQRVQGFGGLNYPMSHLSATRTIAQMAIEVVDKEKPDLVVIEETNGSRSRYTQKILEWIHMEVCSLLLRRGLAPRYINTGDWRRVVGARLTKEDKKLNAKVRKLKAAGDKAGLKALGVRGKVGKKHVAVRYVNNQFGLNLKMKDNDQADAICLGVSYFLGAPICDGT